MTTETYTYDEQIVSDLHKEVFNFRPRSNWWANWNRADDDGKQAIWDSLCEMHNAEMARHRESEERACREFEEQLENCQKLGAEDRNAAIRWVLDTVEHYGDYGRACYELDLPFRYEQDFKAAMEEVA